MSIKEKVLLHPKTRVKWQDQQLMLEREDIRLSSVLADLTSLQLIQHFAKPMLPDDVTGIFGNNEDAKKFIGYLIEKKFLITEAQAKIDDLPLDIQAVDDGTFARINSQCSPFTMSHISLQFSLYQAAQYLINADIKGDIVECGVWQGGSAMLCALTFLEMGVTDRKFYLYDSYDYTWPGFSKHDATIYGRSNQQTGDFVENQRTRVALEKSDGQEALLSLEKVRNNMVSTGYPQENIIYVRGYVEDTIPNQAPDQIALLRLDTDLYDSTLHELKHLYPLLSKGGVLLIDDYPTEEGAVIATEEYFAQSAESILLHRIEIQGRIGVR